MGYTFDSNVLNQTKKSTVTLPVISISIVSHLQSHLVEKLLADIDKHCKTYPIQLLLTLNVPERIGFDLEGYSFSIDLITNSSPMGFAANHNQAFSKAEGHFFCVMNPDIRINKDPFPVLISSLNDLSMGVTAPIVVNPTGQLEDSARLFPTPFKIICKAVGRCKGSDYIIDSEQLYPDWVGGMFMLFNNENFEKLAGFDTKYFLYYEDVDICARLRLLGYQIVLCPRAEVIHDARRSSHKSYQYLKWHIKSMLRFFCSPVFMKILWKKLIR